MKLALTLTGYFLVTASICAAEKAEDNVLTQPVVASEDHQPKTDPTMGLIAGVVEKTIRPRESDLGLSLPQDENAKATIPTIQIHLSKGSLTIDGVKLSYDKPKEVKKALATAIKRFSTVKTEPSVELKVAEDVSQKRVIESINMLAAHKVEQVTFTDTLEDK